MVVVVVVFWHRMRPEPRHHVERHAAACAGHHCGLRRLGGQPIRQSSRVGEKIGLVQQEDVRLGQLARNGVAERVLGMPREVSHAKDLPFRDVPKGPPGTG